MIKRVKRYENGFILDPAVLSPDSKVSDLDSLRERKCISGVPVTENGKIGSRLLGLCTRRDVDFVEDRDTRLSDIMTPAVDLVTGCHPLSIIDAFALLQVSSVLEQADQHPLTNTLISYRNAKRVIFPLLTTNSICEL